MKQLQWSKNVNSHSYIRNAHVNSKHWKQCALALTIKEIQITVTVK